MDGKKGSILQDGNAMGSRQFKATVLGVTGLAALLRFYRLGAPSLWWDELLTLSTVQVTGSGFLEEVIVRNSNTPLYFWLVQRICCLGGESEFALRLLSAGAGTLMIPFSAALMRRLGGAPPRALLYAFVLAINPLLIWASQEARPYALLIFLGTVSLWSWRVAVDRGGAMPWVAYTVYSVLCVLSHKIGVLFPLIAFFSSLTAGEVRGILKPLVVSTLAFFSAVTPLFIYMSTFPTAYSIDRPMTGMEIPYTFFCYVGGYGFGPSVRELQNLDAIRALLDNLPQLVAGCFPLGVVAIASLVYVRRRSLPFVWMLVGPIALTVLVSIVTPYAYNVRYTLGAVTGFLGIVCHAFPLNTRWFRLLFTYVCVIALIANAQWYFVPKYAKNDARKAVTILSQQLDGDARIAVAPAYALTLFEYYASRVPGQPWLLEGVPSGKSADFKPVPEALVLTREHHVPNAASLVERFRNACNQDVWAFTCVGYRMWVRNPAVAEGAQ